MDMKVCILFLLIATLHCSFSSVAIDRDDYHESLLIKPLQDGTVAAYFQFKTLWSSHHLHSHWKSHYDMFPLAIGSLLNEHEVHELHFSLTNGYWRHKRWGMPARSAMSGAELWLWLSPFHSNPQSAWKKITSQLSAQFCTSVDFQKNAVTVNPALSFRPEGLMDISLLKNSSVFHAALPSESVCTENLTPWKKLLPTFARSGLGTLLSATHLFDSSYTSIALDVKPVCFDETCSEIRTEMTLSLTVVFNTVVNGKQSWSLFKLFGSTIPHISPLSSSTFIYVDTTSNSTDNPFELVPEPSSEVTEKSSKLAVYDLSQYFNDSKPFNLAGKYTKNHVYGSEIPPQITITRSVTGYGLHSGGIMARITNFNEKSIRVIYMDVLPWYFRMYLHTLSIVTQDSSRKSRSVQIQPESLIYTPSLSRVSPHHLEILFTLPGNSVTTVTVEFDRSFLKWTEYPPDANHGLYGGSAILTYRSPETKDLTMVPNSTSHFARKNEAIVRLYTECLLISLPTPDFSMPYNVICLVSTVLSLAFGPIYSLTTRIIQPAEIKAVKVRLLSPTLAKIKGVFKRLTGKKEDSPREEDSSTKKDD